MAGREGERGRVSERGIDGGEGRRGEEWGDGDNGGAGIFGWSHVTQTQVRPLYTNRDGGDKNTLQKWCVCVSRDLVSK